jgi:hypothetical protein
MMTNARMISTFLEETQKRDDVPGRFRKLVVCHVIKGNKLGDEIRAVSVPDAPDEDWREAVAAKIAEQAAAEAAALASGLQRYAVQALFEGDDKPHGRVIITVAGAEEDADAISTEGPDAEGLVSSSMRLTEFFAQAFGRSSVAQLRSLQEQVNALTKENESLRAERLKTVRMVEDLYSARQEREIESMREGAKARALEGAADKLGLLIPVAINHIAGRKILPENAPERLILQGLAQRLTPAKLQLLAQSGAFDEAELVALLSILKAAAGPQPPAPAAPANGAAAPSGNGAAAP